MEMTPQYFAVSSVYTDQLVPGKGALFQTFSTWHPNTFCPYCIYWPSTAFYWPSTTKYQSDCLMTGAVFMILFIKNHIIWFPSVQHCNWFGFDLTLTLERRCNFLRRDWELFFLLSPGETRSRLSYDHSRISRRERDSILLLSCFETRSRLQKIISRGRARKNEADSRREFPGSRILADLCFER